MNFITTFIGGLEWLTWALDDMVRDLIETEAKTFCKLVLHYLNIQMQVRLEIQTKYYFAIQQTLHFQVQEISAFLAAESGSLYEQDQDVFGAVILGRNWTQIMDEQSKFVQRRC